MKRFLIAYILLTLLLIILTTGCSTVYTNVVPRDPRCQPRQYCPYTDPPAAVRTEPIRNQQDPAVR